MAERLTLAQAQEKYGKSGHGDALFDGMIWWFRD